MTDPTGTAIRKRAVDFNLAHWFSGHMLRKMRANAHKAHWNTVTKRWLFARLLDEVSELQDALRNGSAADVISECADVANFAAMIADNARAESPEPEAT